MKKLAILMVLLLSVALFGCSEEESAQAPEQESATPTQESANASAEEKATDMYKQVEKADQENAPASATSAGGEISGQDIYGKACVSCHKMGVAGAPKTGDQQTWAPLIDKGMDTLISNAINGVGKMPAKGGAASLSDDEVAAATEYMVEQSR